jgi:hypothetical protein
MINRETLEKLSAETLRDMVVDLMNIVDSFSNWQPIETAPEDGSCLLAINTDEGYIFGVLERDTRGNWIHEGEPTFCHSDYFEPTHWMPLPEPPKVTP